MIVRVAWNGIARDSFGFHHRGLWRSKVTSNLRPARVVPILFEAMAAHAALVTVKSNAAFIGDAAKARSKATR